MADDRKLSPAYVSYVSLKNTLQELASGGHLPAKIDASLLTTMSGSTQTQFLNALRFLSLLHDDGRPSADLKAMATGNPADWKVKFRHILEAKYAHQLEVLKDGSPASFKASFGDDISPSIVAPAARFLLAAAKDVGLPVSTHIAKVGISSAGRSPKKKTDKAASGAAASNRLEDFHPEDEQVSGTFRDRMLEKFPTFDPSWDEARQTAWFSAYEKLLKINGGDA